MSRAVAIGDERRIAGYGLAGAEVLPAKDGRSVVAAWDALGDDVALVILTPSAQAALQDRLGDEGRRVWVVLP
jgi:vacuolar-type H+-ATPase subunit F/Vma7